MPVREFEKQKTILWRECRGGTQSVLGYDVRMSLNDGFSLYKENKAPPAHPWDTVQYRSASKKRNIGLRLSSLLRGLRESTLFLRYHILVPGRIGLVYSSAGC